MMDKPDVFYHFECGHTSLVRVRSEVYRHSSHNSRVSCPICRPVFQKLTHKTTECQHCHKTLTVHPKSPRKKYHRECALIVASIQSAEGVIRRGQRAAYRVHKPSKGIKHSAVDAFNKQFDRPWGRTKPGLVESQW